MERDHKPYYGIRMARLGAAMLLLFLNIFVQIFLMSEIKKFVTARAVHDIREAYDTFEKQMYTIGGVSHVEFTANGKARGIGGEEGSNFGGKAVFEAMAPGDQEAACRIPFSQPNFYYCILFIWSLTVIAEFRKSWLLFSRLILYTDTTREMSHATVENDDGEEVIRGMTLPIKAIICVTILVPRILIAAVLLWLGCRWLTATNDFNDLLLNAVALEFILILKELLYATLVPNRNKHDVAKTKIALDHEAGPPTLCDFLGSFVWGIVTMIWVALYSVYFQGVLPDYKYDVHNVCSEWIKTRYKV